MIMAPAAIYDMPIVSPPQAGAEPYHVLAAVPSKGSALAIGSLATAADGKYQSLVSDLEKSRQVDKQMLDRLLDQGETPHFTFFVRVILWVLISTFALTIVSLNSLIPDGMK